MNHDDYIIRLTDELKAVPTIDDSVVYDEFQPYVHDTDKLSHVISLGLLRYEYSKYMQDIKDTRLESDLKAIIHLFRDAYLSDSKAAVEAFVQNYDNISEGLKNVIQLNYLHNPDIDLSRIDLFAKYSFMQIGNLIEGTQKYYVQLFYNLAMIVHQKKPVRNETLGYYVQELISLHSSFDYLYKGMLYDIEISQWRNIANHNSYRCVEDVIEVRYGKGNIKTKAISRLEIENFFLKMDTVGYLLKIAHVLIGIDYHEDIFSKIRDKSEKIISDDDIIAQVIETSFSYGYETINCKKGSNIWNISIRESTLREFDKSKIIKFLTVLTSFTSPNMVLDIYNCNAKKIIHAEVKNRQLTIIKV